MVFFAVMGFTITDVGLKCSDVGLVDLFTGQECQAAVIDVIPFIPNANYRRQFSDPNFRKGCYIWEIHTSAKDEMYFNSHPTGGDNFLERTRSICKKGNIT